MEYPTNDRHGHVQNAAEALFLSIALNGLNTSGTIAAIEEDTNAHEANGLREDIKARLHVAQVDEWRDADDHEEATCSVCNGTVRRLKLVPAEVALAELEKNGKPSS